MKILISFDIDGTLETGDPPGRVTMDMVRRAQEMGYIIGSASDRPVPVQKAIWEKHGIEVEFTVHKHKLDEVKVLFEADEYHHIGDTNMDEHYAVLHGFKYLDVAIHMEEPWMFLEGDGPTGESRADVPVSTEQPPKAEAQLASAVPARKVELDDIIE